MVKENDLNTYRTDSLLLEIENIYAKAVLAQSVARELAFASAEVLAMLKVLRKIETTKEME